MGIAAFNRYRRLAAEALLKQGLGQDGNIHIPVPTDGKPSDHSAPVSGQPASGSSDQPSDSDSDPATNPAPIPPSGRDEREAVLRGMAWTDLRNLMIETGLSPDKPPDQSWADYATPLLLAAEGY